MRVSTSAILKLIPVDAKEHDAVIIPHREMSQAGIDFSKEDETFSLHVIQEVMGFIYSLFAIKRARTG